MLRRLFLTLFAGLLLHFISFAQINVQWVGRYTTAGNNIDRAKSMVVDSSGNSCVVGTSWNGANFDIVTLKFDSAGNQLWASSYNGTGAGYDEARAITTDTFGNVYVTGYSAGPLNYDIVTIKYNSAGVQQWASRYNGTANGFDEGYDIAVDFNGNVYVCGGATTTTSNANYVTIKYNAAGTQVWATTYSNNNSNTEAAYAIALDPSNNVYVTGTSYGPSANDNDIATIKYNNVGVQQWARRFNGPGSVFDAGTDIVVSAAGEAYVTGYARDLVGTTNYSFATLKYNTTGVLQWSAIYDGTGGDYDAANAICLTPAGNVAVTGRSLGTSATAEDCTTILYDGATGASIWVRRFDGGAVQYDEGISVAADSSNRIFVTGYSYSPGANNNYLTIKYEANGDTAWIVKYNGPGNNSDQAYSIALGPTGEIYVGGMSKGLGTNEDYAVVKYCQLTATGTGDTAICLGASTQLFAASSYGAVDSVWWTPQTGLNQSNILNPVATPNVTTPYVLHLRNEYGCVDLDTVVVSVFPLPGPDILASGPTSFCIGDSVTLTALDTNNVNLAYYWNTGDTTQAVTVDSAGVYTVTITNNSSCSSQSNISVGVFPLPVINAGSDAWFCTSATVQICATGASVYAWTPAFGLSDTTIACPTAGPTQSTTYFVFGTDTNGCISSDTISLFLYPQPAAPVISQNVAVLTSTPATTYQWYFNGNPLPGETNQTYTPTQNGQYYVVITDGNGCEAFSSTFTMMDVGIEEAIAGGLSLFPNPNSGSFTLLLDQRGMNGVVEIFDLAGQRIFSRQLAAGTLSKNELSLEVEAGAYLLRVQLSDGTVMMERVLVQ
jgi:uncharacterized delta-60 repeat protein